ncbi:DUF3175 domain-containing protein [Edaphobacter aggregans]
MCMLTYFINRAGKGLSAKEKQSWKKQKNCFRNGHARPG